MIRILLPCKDFSFMELLALNRCSVRGSTKKNHVAGVMVKLQALEQCKYSDPTVKCG